MLRLQHSNGFGFMRFVFQRLSKLRISQTAGSLTFTTLLALVPLLTIALTVISAFPVFSEYSYRFKAMLLSTLVPEFAGKIITVYMRQFTDNAANLTAAGLVFLGVTALMLMATIERTFNAIWSATRSRPWLVQTIIYWTVITLGPLALGASLIMWRTVFRLVKYLHGPHWLADVLQGAGAVVLTAVVLSVLLKIVPNRFVPWRHAVLGASITAVLLEITHLVFGFYITEIASYKLVYGAFASVPIVLIWVYCLWLVVLGGAGLTASFAYWEGGAWKRAFDPRRRFLDALEILCLLDKAQTEGKSLTPYQMRQHVQVGYDELGWVLDKLTDRGWVQRGLRDDWVLKTKLSSIVMSDVFGLFVYRKDQYFDDEVASAVDEVLLPLNQSLKSMTLSDFILRVERK